MKNLISSNRTIFFCLIISLLCNNTCFAQQGWYQISFPVIGPLKGIYFKDINSGIINGYKTINGGQNWINTNGGYGNLSFLNSNTGFSAGAFLYKTTDFGNNWVLLSSPSNQDYSGVFFININTGYISADYTKIFKTTNSGTSWQDISPVFSNMIFFTGISFIDTSLGFIVGSDLNKDTNVILKTTDGGLSWNITYFSFLNSKYLYSIFMINNNTGIVAGSSVLFKTTDIGSNWIPKIVPTSNNINSIYFSSSNIGYGVCNYGDIIKTTDGGENWFKQTSVTGNDLNTVFFVNDYTGYACGSNGTVLKTTNGGGPPIGIKLISQLIPKEFELYQNYPNPFNPTTKINFKISKNCNVKLTVYNLLGQKVMVLVNDFRTAGKYSVSFDGTNLASGIYFYRIETPYFNDSKKMVLIK